uniref:Uncharacterized protein n=1 Tax=Rubroshorea leprosula TaxID=152421 RepID=A0AAV5K824_9ROSI|nr:hypothetical protein SLEP1_g30260 [Rubroshorea leprosula]
MSRANVYADVTASGITGITSLSPFSGVIKMTMRLFGKSEGENTVRSSRV